MSSGARKVNKKPPTDGEDAGTVKVIAKIVSALVKAHKEGKNVDLDKLKYQVCTELRVGRQPKTVEIIAALPEPYRKEILPKIKAKPIRTASGVRSWAITTHL